MWEAGISDQAQHVCLYRYCEALQNYLQQEYIIYQVRPEGKGLCIGCSGVPSYTQNPRCDELALYMRYKSQIMYNLKVGELTSNEFLLEFLFVIEMSC